MSPHRYSRDRGWHERAVDRAASDRVRESCGLSMTPLNTTKSGRSSIMRLLTRHHSLVIGIAIELALLDHHLIRLGPSALRINAGRYTRGRSEGRILCTPCTHPHRFRSVSIPRCSTPDSGRAIQGLPGTHQISNAQRKSRCSLFCGRLRHRRGCKPACPALQLSTGRTPHLRDQVGQRRRDSKLSVVVVR